MGVRDQSGVEDPAYPIRAAPTRDVPLRGLQNPAHSPRNAAVTTVACEQWNVTPPRPPGEAIAEPQKHAGGVAHDGPAPVLDDRREEARVQGIFGVVVTEHGPVQGGGPRERGLTLQRFVREPRGARRP